MQCAVYRLYRISHSQLLNIIILKFNSPVLLNLMGNIFPYCPAVGAIRRIKSSNIDLQEGQCWSCYWECLYCDSSQDIQWNIAYAFGKFLVLRPWDFPWAQAILYRISLFSSQYRFSKQFNVYLLSRISQCTVWDYLCRRHLKSCWCTEGR